MRNCSIFRIWLYLSGIVAVINWDVNLTMTFCLGDPTPENLTNLTSEKYPNDRHIIRMSPMLIVSGNRRNLTSNGLIFKKALMQASYKVFYEGFAGAIAGGVQVISLMWLRTTVNYQYRYGVPLLVAIRDLYLQEGFARFYQGLPFALIQGPLARFGSIAANEASIMLAYYYSYTSLNEQDDDTLLQGSFLSTALGSVLVGLWRLFLMPIDTCKTVLQVDGVKGFHLLVNRVCHGDIHLLYAGAIATMLSTIVGYYPWFMTFNYLDKVIVVPAIGNNVISILRNAIIGFVASAASDIVSNSLRVVKTIKQANSGENHKVLNYLEIIRKIVSESGVSGLFGRGLTTRILTNGIQSMLFTVIWRLLSQHFKQMNIDSETIESHVKDSVIDAEV